MHVYPKCKPISLIKKNIRFEDSNLHLLHVQVCGCLKMVSSVFYMPNFICLYTFAETIYLVALFVLNQSTVDKILPICTVGLCQKS